MSDEEVVQEQGGEAGTPEETEVPEAPAASMEEVAAAAVAVGAEASVAEEATTAAAVEEAGQEEAASIEAGAADDGAAEAVVEVEVHEAAESDVIAAATVETMVAAVEVGETVSNEGTAPEDSSTDGGDGGEETETA